MNFGELYKQETLRSVRVAYYFRWALIAITATLSASTLISEKYVGTAARDLFLIGIYAMYNLYLWYFFQQKQHFKALTYFSAFFDVSFISLHVLIYSLYDTPNAVTNAATTYFYFIFIFLAALHFNKKLLIFTTFYSVLCFNLIYYSRLPEIDPVVIEKVISADPLGHTFKSVYILLFGLLMLYLPNVVFRLLENQKQVLESKSDIEKELALEKQASELSQKHLAWERELNAKLSEEIEERKQIQAALRASEDDLKKLNATKDRFFSIIAHDLKNPFSVLLSLSDFLVQEKDKIDRDSLSQVGEAMHRSAKNVNSLLENLLNWSRSQTGSLRCTPARFEVLPFLKMSAELFAGQAQSKKISLAVDCPTGLFAFADLDMMRTVLRNLLSNAVKFTPTGGKIGLLARKEQHEVEISVRDSGVGIAPEDIKKLFRIEESFSSEGTGGEKGTGLGLVLAKEFAEQNGGTLWAESTQGKGSRFFFRIPAAGQG